MPRFLSLWKIWLFSTIHRIKTKILFVLSIFADWEKSRFILQKVLGNCYHLFLRQFIFWTVFLLQIFWLHNFLHSCFAVFIFFIWAFLFIRCRNQWNEHKIHCINELLLFFCNVFSTHMLKMFDHLGFGSEKILIIPKTFVFILEFWFCSRFTRFDLFEQCFFMLFRPTEQIKLRNKRQVFWSDHKDNQRSYRYTSSASREKYCRL